MAVKRKNGKAKRNGSNKNYFNFSSDKKKRIIGIFLILFSVFLFLSIISYNGKDELLYTKLFCLDTIFNPPENVKDQALNWLGANRCTFFLFLH